MLLAARLVRRAILPSGDSSHLRIKDRQALIYTHFQIYSWTSPVIVVRHSVHCTLARRRLHLITLKLHAIRTSRSPHSLAPALTLLRTGET